MDSTGAQMNPNSYRLQEDGEVDAADIAALLAELKDVGGAVEEVKGGVGGRPLSAKTMRRGVVGNTNVLTDQQRSGNAAPVLGQHRRSIGGRNGSGSSDLNAGDKRSPSAVAAAGSLAPIGYSTYDPAEAARMEAEMLAQLQPQLSATPLGVRLLPLTPHGTSAGEQNVTARTLLPPTPPKRPHPPPPPDSPTATRPAVHRSSLSSQPALPALPSLPKRMSGTAIPEREGMVHLRTTGGTSEGAVMSGSEGPTPSGGGAAGAAPVREINFLPIMCARYLRPVGLTPTARWGHTLTPISPDTMLLFGGLDVNGAETASLMSFNPTTISWEPLYSLTEAPVARHSHAACAYDGRYLVISGGVAQFGNRVLDDLHLYDTYTHQWRCVWRGERDGSPQNRNEPGPRFGHSIVLHEDRLFLFGGKTVSGESAGRRRGSTTTSPSKAPGPSTTAALGTAASAAAAAAASTTAGATLAGGSDVYVFSLNSYRWRRRVHGGKGRRSSSMPAAATGDQDGAQEWATRPCARVHHAACTRGTTMYVNGGAGLDGVLTDTWSVELTTGAWQCIHRGGTADAVPREKHAVFACGEALLLVGGCSGGGGLTERITSKFTNFAVVLPLVGPAVETPCWIPVAMGNLSIVSPGKKSFGAALSGGFVYVFGGVCGAEPATNTMVRFLAADGCISQHDPPGQGSAGSAAATSAGAQQLRLMLQQLREQQRGAPYDAFAFAGTYGSVSDVASVVAQLPAPWAGASLEDGQALHTPAHGQGSNSSRQGEAPPQDSTSRSDVAIVGLHRALVQQRAPLFLQDLEQCRSELYRRGGATGSLNTTPQQKRRASLHAGNGGTGGGIMIDDDASGDEVDALLRKVGGSGGGGVGGGGGGTPVAHAADATLSKGEERGDRGRSAAAAVATAAGATEATGDGLRVYYTNGTTRIPGLAQPLSAEALQCLIDYLYWGGLKGKYRVLLEEEKEEAEGGNTDSSALPATGLHGNAAAGGESFSVEYRSQLVQTLQTVKSAAAHYKLDPLQELCAALVSGNREAMHAARQRCSAQLRADLAALLNTPSTANTTMLVVDPHTKAKAAHVLHASVLMAASGLFFDLLRPLYRASAGFGHSKASNQVGPLAAKLSATAAQSSTTLLTSTSKRTVLIGPVPLPLPAVRPILRYLYTQELQVSGELAFEVMLGAHQLGLTELQALCEAVVAREEVNYQTCCTFYYLARKYQASLLEEIALLTAVSGFAEVRYSAAYQSLSEEDKQNIDAVATELGSSTWVPPPQPTQEIKSKAAYAARWDASSPL